MKEEPISLSDETEEQSNRFIYQRHSKAEYTPPRPEGKPYFQRHYYEDVGTFCCEEVDFNPEEPAIGFGEANESEWSVQEVAYACRLLLASLHEGPPEAMGVVRPSLDENQLRRIITLIYDAYRYRCILLKALDDVVFFVEFPQLESYEAIICLLMYAMHCRGFIPCTKTERALKRRCLMGFEPLGSIDRLITSLRIKLAASVAKLRIRTGTLVLGSLLPEIISDKRAAEAINQPLMCWINNPDNKEKNSITELFGLRKRRHLVFKFEGIDLQDQVDEQSGKEKIPQVIGFDEYLNDPTCPGCIQCHNCHRAQFRTKLAAENKISILERSLCLAPVAFYFSLMELGCLPGIVALTHPIGMKPILYLHRLLNSLDPAPAQIFIFGCEGRNAYATNVKVVSQLIKPTVTLFAQKWIQAKDILLEYCKDKSQIPLVAVLAIPPSSCTALVDPVSIACSRGGDISIIEALTEAAGIPHILETTAALKPSCNPNKESILKDETKNKIFKTMMDEQRDTLRIALCLPTVQIVLYSTHSARLQENQDIVNRIICEANQDAALRYQKLVENEKEKKDIDPKLLEGFPFLNDDNMSEDIEEVEEEIENADIADSLDSELYDDVDYLNSINNSALRDVLKKCRQERENPPQPTVKQPTIPFDEVPDTLLFELRKISNWEKKGDPECFIACIVKKNILHRRSILEKQTTNIKEKRTKNVRNKMKNKFCQGIEIEKLGRYSAPTFASMLRYHLTRGLSFPICCHEKPIKTIPCNEETYPTNKRCRYSSIEEQENSMKRLNTPLKWKVAKQKITSPKLDSASAMEMQIIDSLLEINKDEPFNNLETFLIHKIQRHGSFKQKDTDFEKNEQKHIVENERKATKNLSCPWLKITPFSIINSGQTNLLRDDAPLVKEDTERLDRVYLTPYQGAIKKNVQRSSGKEIKIRQQKVNTKTIKALIGKITKTHKMNKKVKEIKEIISKKSPIWNKKKMYNYKSTKDKTKKYYGYEIQNKNDNELISMKMKEVKKNEEKENNVENKIESIRRLTKRIISISSRSKMLYS